MKGSEDWDTAVTVAFAAEQSTAAAQLLTIDKITPPDALQLAYDEYAVVGVAHWSRVNTLDF
jgi:hypothetical protein